MQFKKRTTELTLLVKMNCQKQHIYNNYYYDVYYNKKKRYSQCNRQTSK